jgi:prephenate dehydratase
MEGHYQDEKVKKALEELEKECRYLKILGSYPVAG